MVTLLQNDPEAGREVLANRGNHEAVLNIMKARISEALGMPKLENLSALKLQRITR